MQVLFRVEPTDSDEALSMFTCWPLPPSRPLRAGSYAHPAARRPFRPASGEMSLVPPTSAPPSPHSSVRDVGRPTNPPEVTPTNTEPPHRGAHRGDAVTNSLAMDNGGSYTALADTRPREKEKDAALKESLGGAGGRGPDGGPAIERDATLVSCPSSIVTHNLPLHTLLFLSPRPLPLSRITETLGEDPAGVAERRTRASARRRRSTRHRRHSAACRGRRGELRGWPGERSGCRGPTVADGGLPFATAVV